MMGLDYRPFFEIVLAHFIKGEMDKFFHCLDEKIEWTIHGENIFMGTCHSILDVKKVFDRSSGMIEGKPERILRQLIVEGNKAVAFLTSKIKGKDGKTHVIEFYFYFEASKDENKITLAHNHFDSLTFQHIEKAWEKKKMTA